MTSPFPKGSVGHGFEFDEFADIPPKTTKKLMKLMARIAEQSYRRGFQQALESELPITVDVIWKWRYDPPLDGSPSPFGHNKSTSLERLDIENGITLRDLFGREVTP
jgi:hypothetical protein